MGWLSGGVAAPHQPDTKGALLMSHANAALTPRARVRVTRLVVEEGWPVSEVAARFQCSWPTVRVSDCLCEGCDLSLEEMRL